MSFLQTVEMSASLGSTDVTSVMLMNVSSATEEPLVFISWGSHEIGLFVVVCFFDSV